MLRKILLSTVLAVSLSASADMVAHFSMDVRSGQIVESVSGERFAVQGNFAPENVPGAVGRALRFDGYTSHVDASLRNVFAADAKQMTVSMWVALPCYPIIQIDTDTSEKTPVITCLDETAKTGFGFYVGFDGKYSFRTYVGGWPVNIDVTTPLPVYEWNHLVAVVDCVGRTVKLYNNDVEVGSSRAMGNISMTACNLYMGQSTLSRFDGPFELMSFNGLIDDITIYNEAKTAAELALSPENTPDLDIPASRFADDLLRPRFHGMPAAGWTNECHGMYYSDGRYHLFFQKNADGPYMARLHWGHISSENLYDWREERIAIAPGDWYDIKGCWSGCVFADDVVTDGKPNIIYTAVDYGRASIAQAFPQSDNLNVWTKYAGNPIIGGRPDGLSDDFRDPYFFRSGDNAYIIVGSSKNGVGTTTLHRYNPTSGMWSNNGDLFFTGTNAGTDGVFWEMPNITPMDNGKWLFTATPIGTSQGVRTLYWTGAIGADGKFVPDANSARPRQVEMNSREGFGLLSPTIYQHNGKTIALGIVPDKLPSASNWKLGWAHCYSLPREWSVDNNGVLLQKPFAALTGMRTASSFVKTGFTLDGTVSMAPVDSRSAEICGSFVVGGSDFGFNIFKSANSEAKIYYNPVNGSLVADFSRLPRLINDGGVYDGVYLCTLPERPAAGSVLKLNVFIDHSVLDIFVNDKWATSIRVFPTDTDDLTVEAYASGATQVASLQAWTLDAKASDAGVSDIFADDAIPSPEFVDVYNMQGACVRTRVSAATATAGLPAGLYLVGNRKVMVK